MLKIDRHQWRAYLLGRRIHHGLTGAILAALGALLMLHDRKDWKEWF